jgi:hypothetical protein
MTSSLHGSIQPITLTVNGRIGLTLWAPPWEDEDGEEWQGFLGDGAKILLYPSTQALAEFIASGAENDLSDHPAWDYVAKSTPDQLRASSEHAYDLDAVYDWASGDPDPVNVSALANVVDMVARIADCCDDGALRRLVENTPEYEYLVDDDVSYQGKEGRKRWNQLGDTISETWERAVSRVEGWLSWQGDFSSSDLGAETVWDRVGAEPIGIVLPGAHYLTVRGYLASEGDAERAVFLGPEDTVAVFSDVAGLARYCRTAEEHSLRKLEWWAQLADVEDDSVFQPALDATFDLRKPSRVGAQLVRELVAFCNLSADTSILDTPNVDRDDWNALVEQVATCLEPQD